MASAMKWGPKLKHQLEDFFFLIGNEARSAWILNWNFCRRDDIKVVWSRRDYLIRYLLLIVVINSRK